MDFIRTQCTNSYFVLCIDAEIETDKKSGSTDH